MKDLPTTMSNGGCERFTEETRHASPANLLTKLQSFSSFANCGIAQYESKPFEAGGYKWKMTLYPESEKEECHVCVEFAIAETESLPAGWEVNAILTFFVYNHHMNNYLSFRGMTRRFNGVNLKCGFSKLISKKTMMDPSKGFIVKDSCVFGAEVFVIKNPPINECLTLVQDTAPFKREWEISGFSKLGYFWKSEEFVVGDHKWEVTVDANNLDLWQKGRYMSVFLKCVDLKKFCPLKKVKAEICMRIGNKLNANHVSLGYNLWFTSEYQRLGFPEFLSIHAMSKNGCLIGDCFFLDVEMCVHDAHKI